MGNAPESMVDPNGTLATYSSDGVRNDMLSGSIAGYSASDVGDISRDGTRSGTGPGSFTDRVWGSGMAQLIAIAAAEDKKREDAAKTTGQTATQGQGSTVGNLGSGGNTNGGDPQDEQQSSSSSNWTLLFTGQARDVTYRDENNKEVTRQIGEGKLSILDGDGKTIVSFDAISGPGTNGLLPNGEYKTTRLTIGGGFSDETGLSYKLFLDPIGKLANGFSRTELRIHPTMNSWTGTLNGVKKYDIGPTDGCIGLVGNANAAPFLSYMKTYFKNHKFINLNVNIIDNANIKNSIKGKSHY